MIYISRLLKKIIRSAPSHIKEKVLLKQQIELLNKKNDEASKNIESNQKKYEERLLELISDFDKEKSNLKNKISQYEKNLRDAERQKEKEIEKLRLNGIFI